VGVPGAKEILAQWVLHVTAALVHQKKSAENIRRTGSSER
jgi:hypothetical protein